MKKRFEVLNKKEVLDRDTNLVWMREPNYKKMNWQKAKKYCESLGVGWRLPTRHELEGLLDLSNYDPALPDDHPFINVQSFYYWSCTSFAYDTDYAWYVYMNYGSVGYYDKSINCCVWPVRSEK